MSDFDVIVFGMLLAREGYRVLGIDRANATRLVSLASPQNLSDVAIPRTVLAEVLSVMAARCPDALLLLDETYRCAVYGDDACTERRDHEPECRRDRFAFEVPRRARRAYWVGDHPQRAPVPEVD